MLSLANKNVLEVTIQCLLIAIINYNNLSVAIVRVK